MTNQKMCFPQTQKIFCLWKKLSRVYSASSGSSEKQTASTDHRTGRCFNHFGSQFGRGPRDIIRRECNGNRRFLLCQYGGLFSVVCYFGSSQSVLAQDKEGSHRLVGRGYRIQCSHSRHSVRQYCRAGPKSDR